MTASSKKKKKRSGVSRGYEMTVGSQGPILHQSGPSASRQSSMNHKQVISQAKRAGVRRANQERAERELNGKCIHVISIFCSRLTPFSS